MCQGHAQGVLFILLFREGLVPGQKTSAAANVYLLSSRGGRGPSRALKPWIARCRSTPATTTVPPAVTRRAHRHPSAAAPASCVDQSSHTCARAVSAASPAKSAASRIVLPVAHPGDCQTLSALHSARAAYSGPGLAGSRAGSNGAAGQGQEPEGAGARAAAVVPGASRQLLAGGGRASLQELGCGVRRSYTGVQLPCCPGPLHRPVQEHSCGARPSSSATAHAALHCAGGAGTGPRHCTRTAVPAPPDATPGSRTPAA